MYDFREWKHAFKLDPNKEISDESLEKICESGTDAIIVGGSDSITLEKVLDIMSRVRRYTVPCVLEVSTLETVTPGFDLYFIPSVLNSRNPDWIITFHQRAVKEYGEIMDWDEIFAEGYCILNPECKAARLTDADADLTADDVGAYAMTAEQLFSMPIFYLEYSGMFGDMKILEKARKNLQKTVLFYGGGIASAAQAKEAAQYADVIVVGNAVYENLDAALSTVAAVK